MRKSPILRFGYYMLKRKTLSPETPTPTSKRKSPLFWNRHSPVVLVEQALLELHSILDNPSYQKCEVDI